MGGSGITAVAMDVSPPTSFPPSFLSPLPPSFPPSFLSTLPPPFAPSFLSLPPSAMGVWEQEHTAIGQPR